MPQCLLGSGPYESTGFGAVGISPSRLEAWSRGTGWALSPWQFETVLEASAAYANQLNRDKKEPAPWSASIDKVKASSAVKAALRMGRR